MGTAHARWLLCGLLVLLTGCGQKDADRLARVTRLAAAKVQGLTGAAPQKLSSSLQAVRASIDELSLDARVAMRLRWDKALAETHIEVHASGNIIELHGTVTDANQRGRAIDLAQATLGVERVEDQLVLSGPEP